MTKLVNSGFTWFAYQTGILGEIRKYQNYGALLLLTLGIIACFLGFKVYRIFFSLFVFGTIAAVSCMCLRNRIDWGAVVTCFAVIGTVTAFLAYQWYRFGGCVMCGLMGMGIGWLLISNIWGLAAGGILAVLFMLQFPVITICLLSAIWGAGVIAELGMFSGGTMLFILATITGFTVQMFLGRKQRLFAKVCPDRVRYWIENRRKK